MSKVLIDRDWLKRTHRDLDACQKLIWANIRGADPAYCSDAQDRLKEIDEMLALSQQAGPDHIEDMRAMVEPAPAQGEREAFEAWWLEKFCGGTERLRKCINAPDFYYYTAEQEAWKVWQARAALARPTQTEQHPIYQIRPRENVRDWLDTNADGYRAAKAMASMEVRMLYAAPIAHTAPSEVENLKAQLVHAQQDKTATLMLLELERRKTAPQPEQSGWIGVEDRLPEVAAGDEGEFIVCVYRSHNGESYSFSARFLNDYPLHTDYEDEPALHSGWYDVKEHADYDGWYSPLIDENSGDKVTHWMPMPAAPAMAAQGESHE